MMFTLVVFYVETLLKESLAHLMACHTAGGWCEHYTDTLLLLLTCFGDQNYLNFTDCRKNSLQTCCSCLCTFKLSPKMSSFKVSFFCVISIYVFDEAEVLFKQGFSIPSA